MSHLVVIAAHRDRSCASLQDLIDRCVEESVRVVVVIAVVVFDIRSATCFVVVALSPILSAWYAPCFNNRAIFLAHTRRTAFGLSHTVENGLIKTELARCGPNMASSYERRARSHTRRPFVLSYTMAARHRRRSFWGFQSES